MQSQVWSAPAKNAFFMYSIFLRLFGVWPLVENTVFVNCRVMIEITDLISGLIEQLGKVLTGCGPKETIVDTMFAIAFYGLGISKGFFLHFNRSKLGTLFISAFNDWDVVRTKRYTRMMLENSSFCNALSKWFYISGLIALAAHLIKSLIVDEYWVEELDINHNSSSLKKLRNYGIPGGCLYDDYGLAVYYVVLVKQGVHFTLITFVMYGCDSTYVAITDHLCTQCQILKIEFSEFGQFSDVDRNKQQLNRLIARHQYLMETAKLLEDVFNPIIFAQMIMTVVIVSIGGYTLLVFINEANMLGMGKASALILFLLLESYIFTFPADNLQGQANELQQSLYGSAWYKMPATIREDMVFMMMRINLPPYITVGKFFYMTRRSYMAVIKTAASYLSVLRIMLK